jgi:hypothetical protein
MAEHSAIPVIIVRPVAEGWQVFEEPGPESLFVHMLDAVGYARERARNRVAIIEIYDAKGALAETIVRAAAGEKS